MILAAVAGNSHTVVGLVDDGKVEASWRVSTDPRRTADEWMVLFKALVGDRLDGIEGVALCATVPAVVSHWRRMLAETRSFTFTPTLKGTATFSQRRVTTVESALTSSKS